MYHLRIVGWGRFGMSYLSLIRPQQSAHWGYVRIWPAWDLIGRNVTFGFAILFVKFLRYHDRDAFFFVREENQYFSQKTILNGKTILIAKTNIYREKQYFFPAKMYTSKNIKSDAYTEIEIEIEN